MKTTITEIRFISLVVLLVACVFSFGCASKKPVDGIDPSLFPPGMFTSKEARDEVMEWLRYIDEEESVTIKL